jgi:hypothetical protein
MRVAWEEPFGPILPVIRIKTVEEGIHHCNANNFALQVCVISFYLGALCLEQLSPHFVYAIVKYLGSFSTK